MTDTEAKALAHSLRSRSKYYRSRSDMDAIMDAGLMGQAADYIEATEARHAAEMQALKERFGAFRQDVSDAVEQWKRVCHIALSPDFDPFILPAPDPLVDAVEDATRKWATVPMMADGIRAAMQARGYEWRKIGEAGE